MRVEPNKSFTIGWQDYPSKEDCCVLIYFVGCNHRCPNCGNIQLQSPKFGVEISTEDLWQKIQKSCRENKTSKVVFIGGDPLYKGNIDGVRELTILLKNVGIDVCLYTGYLVNYVRENNIRGFKFLKTGKFKQDSFIPSEKTDEYIQFASTNQKLYDSDFNLISEKGKYLF